MIKEIQQISILTLLLRLCYDTINIFINLITTKKENELAIVRNEMEETNVFNEPIPYETYYISIWPLALGFSCFVASWFLLLAKHVLSRKVRKKGGRKGERNEVPDSNNYLHDKNCPDDNDVSEVSFVKNSGVTNQNGSYQEVFLPNIADHPNTTIYRTQVQNKSFLPIFTQNMLDTGMFPLSTGLNMVSNETPSITSLLQMDCSNSKLMCDMVLENRNISKVEMPMTRSLYTENNRGCKLKFSNGYYDCKSQTLVDGETNINNKSDTSNEMRIQNQDNQILEFLSVFQNNAKSLPKYISCEKSTSTQFLTYNDSHLESFEKRLETVEQDLKSGQEKMNNCDYRINRAEKDLDYLRTQIYTIHSKIEKDNKTNVIILSQVSKDPEKLMIENENKAGYINETDDTEVLTLINKPQSYEVVNRREKKIKKLSNQSDESRLNSMDRNLQGISEKEKLKSELDNVHKSYSQTGDDTDSDGNEIITAGRKQTYQNSDLFLSKIKKRTVALETMFENNFGSTISRCTRKKAPLISVAPHIVPPYKRSTFACTNSRSNLIKIKKKLYPRVRTRII